jgi:phosphopantothenoylcysteine synthetase/decarboxylase
MAMGVPMLAGKRILLIIGGGIAAYKALDLIRRLKEQGAAVTPVLTRSAQEFVTPLSASALAGEKVYTDLFDLTDEAEMGHIELSRAADLVVVAPATADLMAKMAGGHADDLASTLLMATDKRVLIAPAMNVRMWEHPATKRNLATLRRRRAERRPERGRHGLRRIRLRAHGRGARDRRGDLQRHWVMGRSRAPRHRDLGADA